MFLTNLLRFLKKQKLDSVIVHVKVVTEFELCFSPCRNNKDQERHRLCCQSLLIVSFSEPCSFVVVCLKSHTGRNSVTFIPELGWVSGIFLCSEWT